MQKEMINHQYYRDVVLMMGVLIQYSTNINTITITITFRLVDIIVRIEFERVFINKITIIITIIVIIIIRIAITIMITIRITSSNYLHLAFNLKHNYCPN